MILAIAAAIALASPAPVEAVTLTDPHGTISQPFQAWADAAKVPTPDARIVVDRGVGGCGDATVGGCASRSGWIAVRDTGDWHEMHSVFLHELGHEFDFRMPEWKRDTFGRIVGVPGPWYVDQPHVKFSHSELFADLYATCAVSRKPRERVVSANGELFYLTTRDLLRVCRLIRQPEVP